MIYKSRWILCGILIVLSATQAHAVTTAAILYVKNESGIDIKVVMDINDGSGGGSMVVAPGMTNSLTSKNTVYYSKTKVHNNTVTLYKSPDEVAGIYNFKVSNYMNVMGGTATESSFSITSTSSLCLLSEDTSKSVGSADVKQISEITVTVHSCLNK